MRAAANRIAEAALAHDHQACPDLPDRYGEIGRTRYREDVLFNLESLSAAVDTNDAGIFLRYVEWLKIVLVSRGVALDDIAESLRRLAYALTHDTVNDHSIAASYVTAALEQLAQMPTAIKSFICGSDNDHAVARRCLVALLRLDSSAARVALEDALAAGLPLARIYGAIIPALMREVGRLWQINEITVAHEHYCSSAIQAILGRFYGLVFANSVRNGRSVVVACVEGEQHELGARTVADLFHLNGWSTSFLGANLPPRDLIALLKRRPPSLIALSTTMHARLPQLADTIARIHDSVNLPILVGGRLFDGSPNLAADLGVQGGGGDGAAALAIADTMVPQAA